MAGSKSRRDLRLLVPVMKGVPVSVRLGVADGKRDAGSVRTAGVNALLLKVALMILLGAIKFSRRHNLCDDLAAQSSRSIEFRYYGARGCLLLRIVVKDRRTILRAIVWPLAVRSGGIVQTKENAQQLLVAHLLGIKLHLHHFRV